MSPYENLRLNIEVSTLQFNIYLHDILLGHDNGHLWYLPCLFLCFIIAKIIFDLIKNNHVLIITLTISIFLVLGSRFIPVGVLRNTANYFIYFCFGMIFNKHSKINLRTGVKILIITLSVLMSFVSLIRPSKLDVLTSLILLCLAYALVSKEDNKINDTISRNSFGIYLFHSPLIYITLAYLANSNPLLVVLISFLIFGTVAFLMTLVVRKTPARFIIGE